MDPSSSDIDIDNGDHLDDIVSSYDISTAEVGNKYYWFVSYMIYDIFIYFIIA
jgi:hypothetical protein